MKKIGLVLAGGGGRGAYQIGVWKSLRDAGLENYITAVSGASVGGLNAALFIQNDLEAAQRIWESISMNKILTPKYDSTHMRPALFERDGLEKIIDDGLDMRCFDNSERNCWMACVRTSDPEKDIREIRCTESGGKKVTRKYVYEHIEYFNMKYINDDFTRKKIILGTSAMPFVFPKEKIEGHMYGDGGARVWRGDNVPVRPLYDIDKCDVIIIVHLTNMDEPMNRAEFPNAHLLEIFPKEKLGGLLDGGGIFDFTAKGAKVRLQLGYDDTCGLFRKVRESIIQNQELLDVLSDSYEKGMKYSYIKQSLQDEAVKLMAECEKN